MPASRLLRQLRRALDPGEPYGAAHLRAVAAGARIRLVVGIGSAVVLVLVPALAFRDRVIIAGAILAYVLLTTVIDAVAERHQVTTRFLDLVLGLGAIFACSILVPELLAAALLLYLTAVVIDTCIAGLWGGIEASGLAFVLAGVAQWAAPPDERLDAITLILFVIMTGAVVLVVDTITSERRRASIDLERMQQALRSVTGDPGLVPTLDSVVDAASNALEGAFTAMLLREEDHLVMAAPSEFMDAWTPEERSEEMALSESTPVSHVVNNGISVVVSDLRKEHRFPEWSRRWVDQMLRVGMRSMLAVPLRAGGEVLGALMACFDFADAVTADDVRLLESYADQASLVIVRAQAYEQERLATARLQEADRLKDEFVASVSHELRTPLTAAKGFIDTVLLHWERLGEQQRRDMLARASENAELLARQIEQLLDLSRIDAGRIDIVLEPVDVSVLVDDALAGFEPLLAQREVDVRVPHDLCAQLDRDAFRHVLGNLLSNAVKFSGDGSHVEIGARPDEQSVRLWVRDEGIGVPEADQERVFERFYQSAANGSSPQRGAGIGLAIVRHLVELQGGRVWCDSTPGGGATFSFTLQAANGSVDRDAAQPEDVVS